MKKIVLSKSEPAAIGWLFIKYIARCHNNRISPGCHNSIGIYFDWNADMGSILVGPGIPFYAYVIITNPTKQEITGLNSGIAFWFPQAWNPILFA